MNANATTMRQCLSAGLLFGGCLLAAMLLPYAGFALNSGGLFFAPQYLFPYGGFVEPREKAVFSHSIALLLNVLQWCLATAGFAWFARRLPPGLRFLAALATIVLVGLVVNLGFGAFGVTVELDGP
jgi:hypothetical protein